MCCGSLEQSKLTEMSCAAVGKLYLPRFFTLSLGRAFCVRLRVWDSFLPMKWAHLPWWVYSLSSAAWRFLGSWAYFSGQTFGEGMILLLALADNCDLPPGSNRISIYCHVFLDLMTRIKAVFYVRLVQSFLCIMEPFGTEAVGSCWSIFLLQSLFGIHPS